MISLLRTALTMFVSGVMTLVLGTIVIVAAALRVPRKPGGLYETLPRLWSRSILWAAGVKLTVEGADRYFGNGPWVFTGNHVSLLDIPAVVCVLPHVYFVAKRELFTIPVFGAGIRAVGTIPIHRTNQKAAFGAYEVATDRIRGGSSVIVFPEGTRGYSYDIRPFKKGPFVLAVQAQAPIVPVIIRGTMDVLPKKTLRIRPGRVHVHVLDPIPTTGYTYEDRDQLAQLVQDRMDAAMRSLYPHS